VRSRGWAWKIVITYGYQTHTEWIFSAVTQVEQVGCKFYIKIGHLAPTSREGIQFVGEHQWFLLKNLSGQFSNCYHRKKRQDMQKLWASQHFSFVADTRILILRLESNPGIERRVSKRWKKLGSKIYICMRFMDLPELARRVPLSCLKYPKNWNLWVLQISSNLILIVGTQS